MRFLDQTGIDLAKVPPFPKQLTFIVVVKLDKEQAIQNKTLARLDIGEFRNPTSNTEIVSHGKNLMDGFLVLE